MELELLTKAFDRNEAERIAAVQSGDAAIEAQCVKRRDELNAKWHAMQPPVAVHEV